MVQQMALHAGVPGQHESELSLLELRETLWLETSFPFLLPLCLPCLFLLPQDDVRALQCLVQHRERDPAR